MRIYTKTGDKGTTSIQFGKRVSKNDSIIHLLGDLHELNCHIGFLQNYHSDVRNIQNTIFEIGAQLSGTNENWLWLSDETTWLESSIDELTLELTPLRNFILPAGSLVACHAHLASAVCRRVERNLVTYNNPSMLQYINRLSDYLFTLARHSNGMGSHDIIWTPKQKQ